MRRGALALNNNKNPDVDAKHPRKYNKVIDQASLVASQQEPEGGGAKGFSWGGRLALQCGTNDSDRYAQDDVVRTRKLLRSITLRVWRLEFVSARLPSSGPGHEPTEIHINMRSPMQLNFNAPQVGGIDKHKYGKRTSETVGTN